MELNLQSRTRAALRAIKLPILNHVRKRDHIIRESGVRSSRQHQPCQTHFAGVNPIQVPHSTKVACQIRPQPNMTGMFLEPELISHRGLQARSPRSVVFTAPMPPGGCQQLRALHSSRLLEAKLSIALREIPILVGQRRRAVGRTGDRLECIHQK